MNKKHILFLLVSCGLYAQSDMIQQEAPVVQSNMMEQELPLVERNGLINIGIAESNRQQVADRLNALLSNEFVLYTKTLKYHWNVVGKFFGPLHKLFGDQYAQLLCFIDTTAERVRSIGFKPYGTLQEFASQATIAEEPGVNPNDTGMIRDLLQGHEEIIRQIRADIDFSVEMNDMGTNNFLSDRIEKHEKMAWMLRAHLE